MKHIKNDVGSFYSSEDVVSSLLRLCELIRREPRILNPIRGMDDEIKIPCSDNGFVLYPTVKKTTLLYDMESNYFLKILHPITVKDHFRSLLTNRAEEIFKLSERLREHGIKIAEVVAYGVLRKGMKPVYVMKRVKGRSLYDILIKDRASLDFTIFERVINEIARLHKLGYWFGDAHLSHIFVDGPTLTGLIDIDGIRRNRFSNIKRMAKDIAGLNYPGIPIDNEEKKLLLDSYINRLGIKDKERFLKLLKACIKKRWG